jgi:hypothetical protein
MRTFKKNIVSSSDLKTSSRFADQNGSCKFALFFQGDTRKPDKSVANLTPFGRACISSPIMMEGRQNIEIEKV